MSRNDLRIVPPSEHCDLCGGTGWEIVESGAKPCRCREASGKEKLLVDASIPRRYKNATLKTYIPQPGVGWKSQTNALKQVTAWLNRKLDNEKGLLLMGPCGVGKTHLSVSIIKMLMLDHDIPCLFVDVRNLLKEIQKTYHPASALSELEIATRIETVDVLLLDELGAHKPTDWALDTLTRIINTRYNECRLTIATTNYLDKPQAGEEPLSARIGVRLRSRVYEMCELIQIAGEDFRMKV